MPSPAAFPSSVHRASPPEHRATSPGAENRPCLHAFLHDGAILKYHFQPPPVHLRINQVQRKLALVDMLEPQSPLPFLQHHAHMLESLNPTATLLEHALLPQGLMGVSKVAFPRRLQLQNRN